ncbi:MAG: hypothetical protein Q8M73_05140 [Actinomycetota bacterium]|nr:hypothetical protein [Actinomycetota bacterium]
MRLVDGRSWAVLPTLVINWAVFAQIVSFQGLVLWVAATSLLCWFMVSAVMAIPRRVLAWVIALGLPPILAAAAEFFGGTNSGSIARASFVACGLTTAAALIASTRYARLVLVPMTLLLVCALALGAAGNAIAWVGAWVVAAGFTLVILGPYGEHELITKERLRFLVLVLSFAGLAAVAAAAVADLVIRQPWVVHPQGLIPKDEPTPTPSSSSSAPALAEESGGLADLLAALGSISIKLATALAVVAVIWLGVNVVIRFIVAIGWRLGLRELETGTTREQVLGAWSWARLRLAQRDQSLPVHLSPDVAVRWAADAGRPELAELAALVAPVAFGASAQPTPDEAYRAWVLADEIEFLARGKTLRTRWRHARRSISSVRLDLARQAMDLNQRAAGVPS